MKYLSHFICQLLSQLIFILLPSCHRNIEHTPDLLVSLFSAQYSSSHFHCASSLPTCCDSFACLGFFLCVCVGRGGGSVYVANCLVASTIVTFA